MGLIVTNSGVANAFSWMAGYRSGILAG